MNIEKILEKFLKKGNYFLFSLEKWINMNCELNNLFIFVLLFVDYFIFSFLSIEKKEFYVME